MFRCFSRKANRGSSTVQGSNLQQTTPPTVCELGCTGCGYNWYDTHKGVNGAGDVYFNQYCNCCGGTQAQQDACKKVCPTAPSITGTWKNAGMTNLQVLQGPDNKVAVAYLSNGVSYAGSGNVVGSVLTTTLNVTPTSPGQSYKGLISPDGKTITFTNGAVWTSIVCDLGCTACGYNWYDTHKGTNATGDTWFNQNCGCCGGTQAQQDACKQVCLQAPSITATWQVVGQPQFTKVKVNQAADNTVSVTYLNNGVAGTGAGNVKNRVVTTTFNGAPITGLIALDGKMIIWTNGALWTPLVCELGCTGCGYNWYQTNSGNGYFNQYCNCCGGTQAQQDACKQVCVA